MSKPISYRPKLWFLFLVLAICFNGTWTTNEFGYKPSLGARGTTEKGYFDSGLDRIDTRLGKVVWVGDPKYGTTVQTALTAIGTTNPTVLRVPVGTWAITADLPVPANVTLKPERGAILTISTTKTLTINGPLEAGPYQIFSCAGSGKVLFGSGTVKEVYPEWWATNTTPGTTDMQPAIQAALNSLPYGGKVQLCDSIYKLETYYSAGPINGHLIWPQVNGISLVGVGTGATTLRGKDHAVTEYGVIFIHATSSAGIYYPRVADLTIRGAANQAAVPG